jgi:mRNA interferase RelE/StbE
MSPYPAEIRVITGEEHAYRLQVGDSPVVYDVLEDTIVVLVLRVGHRKDVSR